MISSMLAVLVLVGVSSFLAMGGALLLVPVMVVGLPVALYFIRTARKSEGSLVRGVWRSLPHAAKLEQLAERIGVPVLITHRDSTEVIFANTKATEMLGGSLVGRTAMSEGELFSKPLQVAGAEIDQKNHPALQMKLGKKQRMRTSVTWRTPTGERSLDFRARQILMKGSEVAGEFLFVKMRAATP